MPKSLKDKHRDRPWFDREGDLWFWDDDKDKWHVCYYSVLTNLWRGTVHSGIPERGFGPYRLAVPKVD